jgi:AcrR family transcriptional regulator
MVDAVANVRTGARALTRAAVRTRLSGIALHMVAARGYDETTVEAICAAAGISRATFFRYFSSKEDAVLGETLDAATVLDDALAARPDSERPWHSLRRAFDPLLQRYAGADGQELARLVVTTPALAARHHEKNADIAGRLVPEIARRTGLKNREESNPVPAALVAAALACVETAVAAWIADDQSYTLGELLDAAMNAIPAAA